MWLFYRVFMLRHIKPFSLLLKTHKNFKEILRKSRMTESKQQMIYFHERVSISSLNRIIMYT